MERRDARHHRWILKRARLRQMWPATASEIRTHAEGTMVQRNSALCQNTKQVTALSQTSHGFISPPSCLRGRPALHMRALWWPVAARAGPWLQRPTSAGGAIQLPRTAPSLPPHPTGTQKPRRSRPGAKASLPLDTRARATTPFGVKTNVTPHPSLCPGGAPPPWRPEAPRRAKCRQPRFVTPPDLELLRQEGGKRLAAFDQRCMKDRKNKL